MNAIVNAAKGRYRMLYALLAGCGPLRAGDALGLEMDKHISEDCRTLYILQKAKRGVIQPYLTTKNGVREVDLCSALAAELRAFIGDRTSGLLFKTRPVAPKCFNPTPSAIACTLFSKTLSTKRVASILSAVSGLPT